MTPGEKHGKLVTVDDFSFRFLVHWESKMNLGDCRGHVSINEKKALAEFVQNGRQSMAFYSHALCLQRPSS